MTTKAKIFPAILLLLLLCALAAPASAQTGTVAPFTYEILDEETKTAIREKYNFQKYK